MVADEGSYAGEDFGLSRVFALGLEKNFPISAPDPVGLHFEDVDSNWGGEHRSAPPSPTGTRTVSARMEQRPAPWLLRMTGSRRVAPRADAQPRRRASDREPVRGWRPALAVAAAIALLDWGTKAAVAWSLPVGAFREVVPGRVALWHVRNEAMILGLYDNLALGTRKSIALVAAVVASLVILQIIARGHRLPGAQRTYASVFVGTVLGGMLGNLGERVVHWGVTDFLSFHWAPYWLPPGNVADVALFAAIPMAVPVIVFELMGRARRGAASAHPAHHAAVLSRQ